MTQLLARDGKTTLIGVIHLLPLPGGPHPSPGLDAVVERAVGDAIALERGGCDAMILENLGDAPFGPGAVDPYTVAAMTRAALAVRASVGVELGINVLRNDALSALGIAAATGASFVRVNVHVGAMVTDQGIIEGRARQTLLERNRLGTDVHIIADVMVKHAVPLGAWTLEQQATDAWKRGAASAIVVTGTATGAALELDDLVRVRRALPDAPLLAGSGVTPTNSGALHGLVDGAIVGSWLHQNSDLTAPIDADRVRTIRDALG